MNRRPVHMKGITLVEGLVALVVLSIGLLALFNFQADLLTSGAEAKARAEALQLADSKLGELRTEGGLAYDTKAAFVSDANGVFDGTTANVAGTNATFTVTWVSTDLTGPVRKNIVVSVGWTDKQGAQQVQISGNISWNNPELGAALLAQTLPGGGNLVTPTGTAEYGDDTPDYTPGSVPGTPNINDDGSGDGTTLAGPADTVSGKYELIDSSTGVTLLISSTPLASISGAIYFNADDYSSSLADSIWAGAPDISVCTTTRQDGGGSLGQILDGSSNLVYYYVSYKCYMGAGWFGNIGVIMDDGEGGNPLNSNDRSCVGDPNASDTGHADSRHPQLNFTRTYRGYEEYTDSNGDPLVDGSGNRLYRSSGIGAGATLAGDSFLLTTITGTVVDSDCDPELQINSTNEFVNNVGEFVCLSASGCPSILPTDLSEPVASITTHAITGSITAANTIDSIITSDGDSCTVNSGDYSCVVYDLGSGWSGYIEATTASGYTVSSTNPIYFTALDDDSSGNDFTTTSSSTPRTLAITGSITNVNNDVTVSGFTLSDGGACTFGATSYACTTASFTTSWTGTLSISQNKTLCSDGVTNPAAGVVDSGNSEVDFAGVTATSLVKNVTVAKNAAKCPP